MMNHFKKITHLEATNTGMALVLICLLLGNVFLSIQILNIWAIGILIITMGIPSTLKPVALIWINASHFLGSVVSKLLLTSIFLIIVVPIGLIIRLFRTDYLKLTAFKQSTSSVFTVRNHLFTKHDLEHPY